MVVAALVSAFVVGATREVIIRNKLIRGELACASAIT